MKSEDLIRRYAEKYTRDYVDREVMMTLSHILIDISMKDATYENAVEVITNYLDETARKRGIITKAKSLETVDDFDEKGAII